MAGDSQQPDAGDPSAQEGQGIILDPHHRRRDLKLIERAIKEGWDFPAGLTKALPNHIGNIALNRKNDPLEGDVEAKYGVREQIAAARVAVAMDRNNLARAKLAADLDNCDPSQFAQGDMPATSTRQPFGSENSPRVIGVGAIPVVFVGDWYGKPVTEERDDVVEEGGGDAGNNG